MACACDMPAATDEMAAVAKLRVRPGPKGLRTADVARCEQRLVRDGGRPLPSAKRSDVDLLGDAQSVIKFDAEVSDRAVHLGVTKQELNGAQIAGLPVDQRCFRPP